MRIFLIGFMGCGKSTIGKQIAKQMQLDFVDLDRYIAKKTALSINQIFDEKGENAFRKMEKECLAEICKMKNLVVATGGGTPCFSENMQILLEKGKSVYLRMETEDLLKRLAKQQNKRPLIKNKSEKELLDFTNTTLFEREYFYKQANFTVNAKNTSAKEIMNLIN
ncbi:MAG: shikimate kinase [Bacteroidota bacterium]|nr:shikimate kinase [Bacteroidota bacterium]